MRPAPPATLVALALAATVAGSACTHYHTIPDSSDVGNFTKVDHFRGLLEGAGIGLAAGAAGGVVIGFLDGDEESCGEWNLACSAEAKAVIFGFLLGGLGTVAGGTVGGIRGSRHVYERRSPYVPSVTAVAAPGRAAALAVWTF